MIRLFVESCLYATELNIFLINIGKIMILCMVTGPPKLELEADSECK